MKDPTGSANKTIPPLRRPGRSRRPPGTRARRLRWTILLLIGAGAAGIFIGGWIYRQARPDGYRPGEILDDITLSLDRDLPPHAPVPRFRDVTREAGLGDFRTFNGLRSSQLPEDMGPGAAWGDFDNDGDEDLFLVSAGGNLALPAKERAPSELYENLGDGTFRRVDSFPETRIIGMGAAWGDYDGDGWLDLVVTGYGSLILYRNEAGRFSRVESFPEPIGFWAGATWGDFDNDRDIDLYVCGYVQYEENEAGRAPVSLQYGRSVPFTLNPVSYKPERNLLFRNEGNGSFTEVAESLGVANPEGRSLGALWLDFDQDGWLDLYVANDISDNVFFRNRDSHFQNISHAAWVADYRGAMGMAAGDWDRDGDDDLFITHWIAQENALYDSLLIGWKETGDESDGPSVRFIDVADQRGLGQVALRSVGWGAEFADLDADGWLDLVVANGSTFETEEAPSRLQSQVPFLFWNDRGEHFYDLAPGNEFLAVPHVGRGLALADYDNDGAVDILFVHHGEGVQLLRNEMQAGNWIQFLLRGPSAGNGEGRIFGAGTVLQAQVGETRLRRVLAGPSYLSQSSRIVHLGLGEATRVDQVEVAWHGGGTGIYRELDANFLYELTEGDPVARRISPRAVAAKSGGGKLPISNEEDEKARLLRFWDAQRSAMQAMKIDGDIDLAIDRFREALSILPDHEDSLYYLANCLAERGDIAAGMEQLETLIRINPNSHRGHKQLGIIRASSTPGPEDLVAARESLEKALAINPEETGALLVLGEIALMQGDLDEAESHFSLACRTNPQATGGFFLGAYIAWEQGKEGKARELLDTARATFKEEWKPKGTTSEGDVERKMHTNSTPLSEFWENWDGVSDPEEAFAGLHARLQGSRKR